MSKHKALSERSLINQKIREVRKAQKLTQSEVAKKLGMLYDTYSKKERSGKITIDWLLEFSNAVGVSPEVFNDVLSPMDGTLGKTFTFKQPSTIEEFFYGDNKKAEPETEIEEEKQPGFELSATEKSIIEVYRGLSKSKQKEVRDFISSKR